MTASVAAGHRRRRLGLVVCSGRGPGGILDRLRLPDESADPYVLNFGPAPNGNFFRCLYHAHAVVPYRVEGSGGERRLDVYDPNYPKDRGRYVSFRGGGFRYGSFSSGSGWGVTLVPFAVVL